MRDRGSVVIIEKNKAVLIQRIRDNSIYYIFPGGGIENREAFEELGVNVKVNECILEVEYNGTQYFFLSEIISGTLGTGQGEEYTNINRDRGMYFPLWVDIERFLSIDVRPNEVA